MNPRTLTAGTLWALTLAAGPLSVALASELGMTEGEKQQIQALHDGLSRFDREYWEELSRFSERERECLTRFISAACLDELRRDAAQARRQHELAKELLRRDIRQIEANVRHRQRLQADAARSQRLGEPSSPSQTKGPSSSGQVRLD